MWYMPAMHDSVGHRKRDCNRDWPQSVVGEGEMTAEGFETAW